MKYKLFEEKTYSFVYLGPITDVICHHVDMYPDKSDQDPLFGKYAEYLNQSKLAGGPFSSERPTVLQLHLLLARLPVTVIGLIIRSPLPLRLTSPAGKQEGRIRATHCAEIRRGRMSPW